MSIENFEFSEAVEHLARRYNMPVEQDAGDRSVREKRDRLYALNREAARFYHDMLNSKKGEEARAYLDKRKIAKATAIGFGLGYAPDSWDSLLVEMTRRGFEKFELIEAGLASKGRNGGIYDFFRNKLMFPIIDIQGNVTAFGGRVLDNSLPKYINTSDTPVFDKRRNLYALYFAKRARSKKLLIVEGYMDVITLHQAGFENAVASLGTAFTQDHAKLITRVAEEVILIYDADGAGANAAKRATQVLSNTGLRVKILRIPGKKDPDDYIKEYGAGSFAALLERGESPAEYSLADIEAKYMLDEDSQRVLYVKDAADFLASMRGGVEREVYAGRVAEKAKLDKKTVISEIERIEKLKYKNAKREQHAKDINPGRSLQPAQRELRYSNPQSAVCEEIIVRLLTTNAELLPRIQSAVTEDEFSSKQLGAIYKKQKEMIGQGRPVNINTMMQELTEEENALFAHVIAKEAPTPSDDEGIDALCRTVKQQNLLAKKQESDKDALTALWQLKKKAEENTND